LLCGIGGGLDLSSVVKHGPAGVDLFMVLSGFCLFWPLTAKEAVDWSWQAYALKRVRRILPAYYGALCYSILLPILLVGAVRFLGWHANVQPVPSLRQILTHVFLVHSLFRDTWNGISGAFWSMGLEAQFYVVFPGVVYAWNKYGISAIVGVAGASLLFRVITGQLMMGGDPLDHFLLSITFLGRWMQFAAGMAAALVVRRAYAQCSLYTPGLGVALVVGGMALSWLGLCSGVAEDVFQPWRDLILAVSYAALLIGVCISPKYVRAPLLTGPLPWVGKVSYSFFLIHQPTSWYFMELTRKKFNVHGANQVWLGYSIGLVVTLLFASIYYRLLEKPFLGVLRPLRTTTPSRPVPENVG